MREVQGTLLSMRVIAKNTLDIKTSRDVRQDWLLASWVVGKRINVLIHRSRVVLNEVASKMGLAINQ